MKLMQDLSHNNKNATTTATNAVDSTGDINHVIMASAGGSTAGLDIASIDALMQSLAEKKRQLEACDDETQSEILLSFLKQMRSTKQAIASRLQAELSILDHDIQQVETRRLELGFTTRVPSPAPMLEMNRGVGALDASCDTCCTTMATTMDSSTSTSESFDSITGSTKSVKKRGRTAIEGGSDENNYKSNTNTNNGGKEVLRHYKLTYTYMNVLYICI